MSKNDNNLVWIDMEMTGLDPETCVVMEIATIVTDPQLNILAEGPRGPPSPGGRGNPRRASARLRQLFPQQAGSTSPGWGALPPRST